MVTSYIVYHLGAYELYDVQNIVTLKSWLGGHSRSLEMAHLINRVRLSL